LRDGELVATGTPADLVAAHGGVATLAVDTESPAAARAALAEAFTVTASDDGVVVRDVTPREIGDVATALDDAGVAYGSLAWSEPSLEDVYLSLTGETFDATRGGPVGGSTVGDGSTGRRAGETVDGTRPGTDDSPAEEASQ
jgi:ABC-2 type transport system ATP-binding protein